MWFRNKFWTFDCGHDVIAEMLLTVFKFILALMAISNISGSLAIKAIPTPVIVELFEIYSVVLNLNNLKGQTFKEMLRPSLAQT